MDITLKSTNCDDTDSYAGVYSSGEVLSVTLAKMISTFTCIISSL